MLRTGMSQRRKSLGKDLHFEEGLLLGNVTSRLEFKSQIQKPFLYLGNRGWRKLVCGWGVDCVMLMRRGGEGIDL